MCSGGIPGPESQTATTTEQSSDSHRHLDHPLLGKSRRVVEHVLETSRDAVAATRMRGSDQVFDIDRDPAADAQPKPLDHLSRDLAHRDVVPRLTGKLCVELRHFADAPRSDSLRAGTFPPE